MSFMQRQLLKDKAYQIETTHGTEVVPFHVAGSSLAGQPEKLQQYCEGKIRHGERIKILPLGWVYRLSAPGYLDCTAWNYASDEPGAIIHLRELDGDPDDE